MENPVDDMSFSEALKALKMGNKVARLSWDGFKAWIKLETQNDTLTLPYVVMKTARGHFVPWLPNQCDLLAEDWWIVTE